MDPSLFRPPPRKVEPIGLGYNLHAKFEFRTDSSCSFVICQDTPPGMGGLVGDGMRLANGIGVVTVHFPCDGIVPVRIFGTLPEADMMRALDDCCGDEIAFPAGMASHAEEMARLERKVRDVCHWLLRACKIPPHLHHKASFVFGDGEFGYSSDPHRSQYEVAAVEWAAGDRADEAAPPEATGRCQANS